MIMMLFFAAHLPHTHCLRNCGWPCTLGLHDLVRLMEAPLPPQPALPSLLPLAWVVRGFQGAQGVIGSCKWAKSQPLGPGLSLQSSCPDGHPLGLEGTTTTSQLSLALSVRAACRHVAHDPGAPEMFCASAAEV